MGILVDYFAASADELARLDLQHGPAGAGWPHVDCKGWLDGAAWLAAELTGADPSEFADDALIDDGGGEGPWLTRVPDAVTAALGGLDEGRLQGYAEDELLDAVEIERYSRLLELARTARASGRDLYCWSSL